MLNTFSIQVVYEDSFRANLYTVNHFRMIGLIDVGILFDNHLEIVTLAYYSSSGTNNGKLKSLWYPIAGIKLITGPFIEFTPIINHLLSQTTYQGTAQAGWLAKSLFFSYPPSQRGKINGFAGFPYAEKLLEIGETLRRLYANGHFHLVPSLNGPLLNARLTVETIYPGNQRTQRQNFEAYLLKLYEASKN